MLNSIIAPSILSANLACLGEDVSRVLDAGASWIHFDVMDNHYVPNLTFGPVILQALREHGIKAPVDVHLMTKPVDSLITSFAKAGADFITFHPDASENVDNSIKLIHELGCKAGLSFNPETPLTILDTVIDKIELILLMGVNPGFGGQKFISGTMDKIKEARNTIDNSGRDIHLSVDGGVKLDNIAEMASSGANVFVAGTAIFKTLNYENTIKAMKREINSKTQ